MIDDRSESTSDPSSDAGALTDQRRLLELRLTQIRNEAAAARLDARAAEIELMIRQLGAAGTGGTHLTSATTDSGVSINPPHIPTGMPALPEQRFESWDDVRSARVAAEKVMSAAAGASDLTRIDGARTKVDRPHFQDAGECDAEPAIGRHSDDVTDVVNSLEATPEVSEAAELLPCITTDASRSSAANVCGEVSIAANVEEDESSEHQRRKPAAWLVSAVAHLAVLLLLAAVTLQTRRPKDQVALSASAAEANQVSMETFTIETSEPEPETRESTPSETEYELSPVGEIAATDFSLDASQTPPSPAASAMASSELSSSAALSLSSDSDAKIQFCGVEGGGNHFVYLVDSSGSMGDGFQSARAELLASIAVLKPDQRFYVVFFDAKSDFMRLGSGQQDEPRSVNATPENKAALKRWAMRIAMDRGRAPYDALRFALNLKPDVIFLLSDGEFPQGIEDLLREENKVENLFGDQYPISIVHTIGYHSKEGESRMRRIAEQNKGQYRYIPKP